tara:strand:+ start:477 stop:923 length:447 start_codon:yes stop_codon:yes gene_type:complete
MNNQKKIEDILYSINELILEAQNEEKKDKSEKSELIDLNNVNRSKTQNFLSNQGYKQPHFNRLIKTKEDNLTKSNSFLKNNWRDLNFKECQEKQQNYSSSKTNIESFENELEKILRDSISFWIKKNLPDIINDETALHTKKMLKEKLK